MKLFFASASLAGLSTVAARTFTVYNACPFTIWPALFTDLHAGSAVPNFKTGWEAPAWSTVTFSVPDNWTAGRIWARRNCDFSRSGGPTAQCLTGGCNGGLECDRNTGTGVPPATIAVVKLISCPTSFTNVALDCSEWTLSSNPNIPDNYDISLVDGYNLPARISNNKGCPVAECAKDLGPNCPAPLKGPFDSTGFPVGCKSACFANLDGHPQDSANCCSGSHNTPQTCPSSGVQYYSYFKSNCPRSYAYAYDENSGTALFTCDSKLKADYTLTFCP
ncbi:thaumatin-like protein [Moniliophthora roreri MCA 2997]|uniref:Thaumatin-like protein n=1 Tax=Moniliophthora roreri (strain MCA 2997) TaxID=1381753 RepID=V2XHH0_MONRO|nr:thaumatin-like protein [Moniliophthora roreri MCA 2997]